METNLLKNTDIQLYRGIKDTIGFSATLLNVLNLIVSGHYAEIISDIRGATNKKERNFLKCQLYAVAFAGLFSKRGKEFCSSPSGIACLDFDELVDPDKTKQILSKSKYCLAAFISPSGNGIKMLIRIPLVIGDERYKEHYNAALLHYQRFKPDTSTKDISRLCFLSHDPNLYVNENAEVLTKRFIAPVSRSKIRNFKSIGQPSEASKIKGLFCWWEKNHWDSSARNNSLFKLAAAFCEFGISEDSAWRIIQTYEETDLKLFELRKVMESAYKRVEFNSKSFA